MAKLTKESFISSLKEMSIKEVMELVEAMKEEFGIDPSAVAVAAACTCLLKLKKRNQHFQLFLSLTMVKNLLLLKQLKNFLTLH